MFPKGSDNNNRETMYQNDTKTVASIERSCTQDPARTSTTTQQQGISIKAPVVSRFAQESRPVELDCRTTIMPRPYRSQHHHKAYYHRMVNQHRILVNQYTIDKSTNKQLFDTIMSSPNPHPYHYVNEYKEEYVYIDPTSIEYQIDTLYRKMIDYCRHRNLKIVGSFVFNKDLKNAFTQFCLDNTQFDY